MNSERTSISEWERLFPENTALAEKYFVKLLAHYEEEHRFYHNMLHIEECLSQFDQVKDQCENAAAVEIAVWCHDVIYNTSRGDNEVKSAEWLLKFLKDIKYDNHTAQMAADFVVATKDHLSTHPDSQLLNDIDLSILGAPEELYRKYRQDIRQEYRTVPDSLYKKGRIDVMKSFLDMKQIYQTDSFKHLEECARMNIANEIEDLGGI